jgi:hypothetical protein
MKFLVFLAEYVERGKVEAEERVNMALIKVMQFISNCSYLVQKFHLIN